MARARVRQEHRLFVCNARGCTVCRPPHPEIGAEFGHMARPARVVTQCSKKKKKKKIPSAGPQVTECSSTAPRLCCCQEDDQVGAWMESHVLKCLHKLDEPVSVPPLIALSSNLGTCRTAMTMSGRTPLEFRLMSMFHRLPLRANMQQPPKSFT